MTVTEGSSHLSESPIPKYRCPGLHLQAIRNIKHLTGLLREISDAEYHKVCARISKDAFEGWIVPTKVPSPEKELPPKKVKPKKCLTKSRTFQSEPNVGNKRKYRSRRVLEASTLSLDGNHPDFSRPRIVYPKIHMCDNGDKALERWKQNRKPVMPFGSVREKPKVVRKEKAPFVVRNFSSAIPEIRTEVKPSAYLYEDEEIADRLREPFLPRVQVKSCKIPKKRLKSRTVLPDISPSYAVSQKNVKRNESQYLQSKKNPRYYPFTSKTSFHLPPINNKTKQNAEPKVPEWSSTARKAVAEIAGDLLQNWMLDSELSTEDLFTGLAAFLSDHKSTLN